MKILVDTNVLLSYLLIPGGESAATTIVEYLIAESLEFVLPDGVVAELTGVISEKLYPGTE